MGIKSFDEKWTTEHIDKYIKQLILLSEHKYTNLLTEILKNKENLNVIIDKESKYGLVYKNNSELFVNMKTKEIIDKSMEKLYEQLNDFLESINLAHVFGTADEKEFIWTIIITKGKYGGGSYDRWLKRIMWPISTILTNKSFTFFM